MKSLITLASLLVLAESAASQTIVFTGPRTKQYFTESQTAMVMLFGGPWSIANYPFDNTFKCTGATPNGLGWGLAWQALADNTWQVTQSGSGTASANQLIVAHNYHYTITNSSPSSDNATQHIIAGGSLYSRTAIEKVTSLIYFTVENP